MTPYGVNNFRTKLGDGMIFGKEDETNAYNFPNGESIALNQFVINYDASKIN